MMLQRFFRGKYAYPLVNQNRFAGWLRILTFGVAMISAASVASAEPPEVRLAKDGKAMLPIKLIDPSGDVAKAFLIEASLNDLQSTLATMTGSMFEMQTVDAYDASIPGIYVGLTKNLGPVAPQGELKLHEAYLRTTENGSLILSGSDSRGVSHAIYRLLFHLGARWYYPGEHWAVIPKKPNVAVSFDNREQPDFPIQRRIWVGHGLRGAPRPAFDDWQRRNFVAQPFQVNTSHTWFSLDNKEDFASHPDWFAEVDGKRKPSKPAYANPEVIQRGIDFAVKYFDEHPNVHMLSLSPPDGLGFDTSEIALKQAKVNDIFEAHGAIFGRQADGTLVSLASENVFHFVNEVARAVAEHHPGKMVGILAYSAYAHPPSFDIEPNVYVELTRGYRRTPLSSVEQIQAFAKKAKNLGIYEYYDVEQWAWERPGRARASDLDYLQGSYRFYANNNMRALSGEMSSNFAPYGVGYYVITRLLWDATQDVREIEREFYNEAFGPAAEPMMRVYRRWESDRGLEPLAVAATYRDLAEATRLTEGMPEYEQRIDSIKMYAHFLKIYLQPKQYGTEDDDVAAWKHRYGEEEAKARVDALGDWVARITNVHVVHGQAFNRYFRRRGEALDIDVTTWGRQGVPSHEEIARIFNQDLKELQDIEVKTIAADVYSQHLVPVESFNKVVPKGIFESGRIDRVRKAMVILKLDAGETGKLTLSDTGASYVISYLTTGDFESGMGGEFATPMTEGKAETNIIEVSADKAGYYFVNLRNGALLNVSHPHALPQGNLEINNGRLFFYVPAKVEHFIVQANAYNGSTIKVIDPAENVVVSQEGFAVHKSDTDPSTLQTRWVIDVAPEMRGRVWCVEGPGDVNATNRPRVTGVPGYYSLAPALLLVPEETTSPSDR